MKIKKYLPLLIILLALAGLLTLSALTKKPDIILFYGETCPHCKNVEEFLSANKTRERIKFQELEVSNNKSNASLLLQKAGVCKLDKSSGIGVPFLFDGEKCVLGDADIIDWFKNK